MGFIYNDITVLILLPAVAFAFFAQFRVKSAYRKYARIGNRRGITGARAARYILDKNGLGDIAVEMTGGQLTDHYDPRRMTIRLSEGVFNDSSLASVGIAAHEVGHAIQHRQAYAPLAVRSALVPVVNVATNITWPIIVLGIVLAQAGKYSAGNLLLDLGVIAFVFVVLFHLVTLPVELNASRRAIIQLEECDIIYDEEIAGAKRVLSAAAMTYVAALAVALANLLRILAIRGRR
ncbi:MAG: zinc metallopeptidase [Clostridia bacterium]|nr:zinc metallopeptidase [Clostridia bacterium]